MKKKLLFVMTLLLTTGLLGCNTMRGAGQDVESAGKGMQKIIDHND